MSSVSHVRNRARKKEINERRCSAHNQIYNSDLWNSELLNGPHSSSALPTQFLPPHNELFFYLDTYDKLSLGTAFEAIAEHESEGNTWDRSPLIHTLLSEHCGLQCSNILGKSCPRQRTLRIPERLMQPALRTGQQRIWLMWGSLEGPPTSSKLERGKVSWIMLGL